MMERVLRFAGSIRIVDDATLPEGRRVHTLLYALDEADILGLEHRVEVFDGSFLGLVRLRCLEEEVVSLKRAVRPRRHDVEHDHRAAAWIAHEAGRRPQPPDSMSSDLRVRRVIGPVHLLAG